MNKIVLDIDQMKHLEELGLYTRDATLMWSCTDPNCSQENAYLDVVIDKVIFDKYYYYKPAYTLTDILNRLPESIFEPANDGYSDGYAYLKMNKTEIWYESWHMDDHHIISFRKDTLIDAAYELMCWCLETNNIGDYGKGKI